MKGNIERGVRALVMHEQDHVATAIEELQAGETVEYRVGDQTASVVLADPIPFGHKFAIRPIRIQEEVRKYGEVIGRSTAAIAPGQHVHVHNVEGIRGRGDQAAGKGERQ